MLPRDQQRLEKIIDHCRQQKSTVVRYGDSLEQFQTDVDYQQSVSFSVLQIGELVNGLSDEFKAATSSEMQWHQIRGMRNIVVHGYGSIDLSVVWGTVQEDIPALEQFCLQRFENCAGSDGNGASGSDPSGYQPAGWKRA